MNFISPGFKGNFSFVRKIGLSPLTLAIPAILSLFGAALEGVSLAALIPFLTGVLGGNFDFLTEAPGFAIITSIVPVLSQNTSHLMIILSTVIAVGILLKNILLYLAEVRVARLIRDATHNVRKLVFDRCLGYGKLFFDRNSLGHLNQILMSYTSQAVNPISQIHQMTTMVFSLSVYLGLMTLISWRLTLFVVLVFPLMNLALARLVARIKHISLIQTESINSLGKQAHNILSVIPLVKLYDNERLERERFAKISYRVADLDYKIIKTQHLVTPLQESMALMAMLMVLGMVVYLSSRGLAIASGSFVVFFYLVLHAITTYGRLHRFQGILARAAGPIKEIRQILNDTDKYVVPQGTEVFSGLKTAIEFSHLKFGYQDEVPVLKDVSFTVPAGSKVALVGATGSGKTTIVSLLLRLYDCPSDSIYLDGRDIRDFTSASIRSHLAFVSQEAWLFNDTLFENITYGLTNVSEERVLTALKQADLYDFVTTLPKGLYTEIGDRGVILSGGEKQRLSIARALLKEAEIVLFDEPTSALDAQTEKLVQTAIEEAMQHRTILIIAHRLATIKHADSIVVLQDGKVVEQGTWHELHGHHAGLFRTFWDAQSIQV